MAPSSSAAGLLRAAIEQQRPVRATACEAAPKAVCASRIIAITAVALACTGFAAALQIIAGAYQAEFSGYPDEPAHYVTATMFDRYVRDGLPGAPLPYMESYYLHYPKVAIGHWPPMLYVLQTGWTLLFSSSRTSVLLFQAMLAGLLALAVFLCARRFTGFAGALVAAAVVLCVPVVQSHTSMVMAEVLLALTMFVATIWFARFLDTERWQDSLIFGTLASMAILTKGSGWALALVPVFAIALTRRWAILRKPALWVAGIPVVVLCLPWQYLTMPLAAQGWEAEASWHYTLTALARFGWIYVSSCGVVIVALAAIGVWSEILSPLPVRRVSSFWAAMLSLILAAWLFHSVVPAGIEARKLIMAIPAVILFALAGSARVASGIPRWGRLSSRTAIVAAAAAFPLFVGAATMSQKNAFGFEQAAEYLRRTAPPGTAVLISSEFDGEGLLISEFVRLNSRPTHYLIRGSKLLAEANWNGSIYKARYSDIDGVANALRAVPVNFIVLDTRPRARSRGHHALLLDLVRKQPEFWTRAASFGSGKRLEPEVVVYRSNGAIEPVRRLEIDLRSMIGKTIAVAE